VRIGPGAIVFAVMPVLPRSFARLRGRLNVERLARQPPLALDAERGAFARLEFGEGAGQFFLLGGFELFGGGRDALGSSHFRRLGREDAHLLLEADEI
jgi:hypothetical protein